MSVQRILHRAGNVHELLEMAAHPAVDAIEADVWVQGSHLWAHHERPLGPIPLLLGRHRLRIRRHRVPLEAILDAVDRYQCDFVIDLRSWFGDPAPDLVRALAQVESRDHVGVTCEAWVIADRLREWLPDLQVAYSIRSARQLRGYIEGRDRGDLPATPVVVRHTLLGSADDLAALRARAGRVGVWTVDDVDRALELVAWGADALTSNHLTVLNAI